jgi:hypothetical protein
MSRLTDILVRLGLKDDKKNLRKWVAALRSGEYEQGKGALHLDGRYCCLGVACDLSKTGEWLRQESRNLTGEVSAHSLTYRCGGEGSTTAMPPKVQEWLGIVGPDPMVRVRWDTNPLPLSAVNDIEGLSFSEIADLIEEKYLK